MAVEKGFGAEQDQRDDVLSGHALSKGLSQEFGLRPVVQLPYCRIDEEGDGEFTDNHQAGTRMVSTSRRGMFIVRKSLHGSLTQTI